MYKTVFFTKCVKVKMYKTQNVQNLKYKTKNSANKKVQNPIKLLLPL